MPPYLPGLLRDLDRPRINRAPSPALVMVVPWLLVMMGSLSPIWPVISSAPVIPPIGFLILIAWEQMRPGLFPVWAGLPLGLFDDLFSGQPIGSGVVLFSLAVIGLDFVETRFPWRGFALNWLVASGVISLYLMLALWIASAGGSDTRLIVIAPQLIVSILVYPLVARLVGAFDRFRLFPIKVV